jgi:hypothetical protein
MKETIIGSAYLISGSILLASAHIANNGNTKVGIIGSILGIIGIIITIKENLFNNNEL